MPKINKPLPILAVEPPLKTMELFLQLQPKPFVAWSIVAILGMVIPPLIGILIYNGYINPYYWVDDHPLLYGNNGSLDPGTFGGVQPEPHRVMSGEKIIAHPLS